MSNKVKHLNYYGFDHEEVNKQFEGDLTYLGDIVFIGQYMPWALYRAVNPNRDLGHKEFMLLSATANGGHVSGREESEIKVRERYKNAIQCKDCKDIIYSCMRHDMHPCKCGKIAIDGGIDYLRYSMEPGAEFSLLVFDILTGKVLTEEEASKIEVEDET